MGKLKVKGRQKYLKGKRENRQGSPLCSKPGQDVKNTCHNLQPARHHSLLSITFTTSKTKIMKNLNSVLTRVKEKIRK